MRLKVEFECPYCGMHHEQFFDPSACATQLQYCDSEDGGCDNLVALKFSVFAIATPFALHEGASKMRYDEYQETLRVKLDEK